MRQEHRHDAEQEGAYGNGQGAIAAEAGRSPDHQRDGTEDDAHAPGDNADRLERRAEQPGLVAEPGGEVVKQPRQAEKQGDESDKIADDAESG